MYLLVKCYSRILLSTNCTIICNTCMWHSVKLRGEVNKNHSTNVKHNCGLMTKAREVDSSVVGGTVDRWLAPLRLFPKESAIQCYYTSLRPTKAFITQWNCLLDIMRSSSFEFLAGVLNSRRLVTIFGDFIMYIKIIISDRFVVYNFSCIPFYRKCIINSLYKFTIKRFIFIFFS